jgi:DUF4097 and DUF4098 domain-containing protein YvlB
MPFDSPRRIILILLATAVNLWCPDLVYEGEGMKMKTKYLVALVVIGLACSSASTLEAAVKGSFERTLQVSGSVDLEVKSGSGSITVRTGASDVVRVVGHIRARSSWGSGSAEDKVRRLEQNPPIAQTGSSIVIGEVDDRELMQNVSISYELQVPAETRLRSATGSGSQTIGDIQGPVDASSGSGSLELGNIGGDVEASTGSGSIRIEAVDGKLRAKTGSGSIKGYEIAGSVRTSSGSGSVEIQQTAPGGVEVETGSGSIELNGVRGALRARTGSGRITVDGVPTGDWELRASSGSINLRLNEDVGFELRARTSSGSIESDHPVTVTGKLSKRELRGQVRGGGPLLEVHTSSGSIRIQ